MRLKISKQIDHDLMNIYPCQICLKCLSFIDLSQQLYFEPCRSSWLIGEVTGYELKKNQLKTIKYDLGRICLSPEIS